MPYSTKNRPRKTCNNFSEKSILFSEKNTARKAMQSVEKKILSKIYGHGRGWVFFAKDFSVDFSITNINSALSQLTRKNKIRRISHGMYDYPKYSKLLGRNLSPDHEQAARAFARKFNWRILPTGDAALNLLGLSTQMVGRFIYLSDGPSRSYEILGYNLEFKKTALKEVGFKHRESGLIVQALKALGKERVSPETIFAIRKQIDPEKYMKIQKDTKNVTGWIHDIIKEICREN